MDPPQTNAKIWSRQSFLECLLQRGMEELERCRDAQRDLHRDKRARVSSPCTPFSSIPEYVGGFCSLLVGEVLAQARAAREEQNRGTQMCMVNKLKLPKKQPKIDDGDHMEVKTWKWANGGGWTPVKEGGGGFTEVTGTVSCNVRHDQQVFYRDDLLRVSLHPGAGSRAVLAVVANCSAGPQANINLLLASNAFSDQEVSEMLCNPIALYVTHLQSMLPTMREVTALCNMHALPVSMLENFLTPEQLCQGKTGTGLPREIAVDKTEPERASTAVQIDFQQAAFPNNAVTVIEQENARNERVNCIQSADGLPRETACVSVSQQVQEVGQLVNQVTSGCGDESGVAEGAVGETRGDTVQRCSDVRGAVGGVRGDATTACGDVRGAADGVAGVVQGRGKKRCGSRRRDLGTECVIDLTVIDLTGDDDEAVEVSQEATDIRGGCRRKQPPRAAKAHGIRNWPSVAIASTPLAAERPGDFQNTAVPCEAVLEPESNRIVFTSELDSLFNPGPHCAFGLPAAPSTPNPTALGEFTDVAGLGCGSSHVEGLKRPEPMIPDGLRDYIAAAFDASQQEAIRGCCPVLEEWGGEGEGVRFQLVQGPPGTGKTHLICGIVSCWLHGNTPVSALDSCAHAGSATQQRKREKNGGMVSKMRVLVCAQSNAGVDEVLTRLDKRGVATSATATRTPCMLREGALDSVSAAVVHLHPENLLSSKQVAYGGPEGRVAKKGKKGKLRPILREVEVMATTLNSAGGEIASLLVPKGKNKHVSADALKFDVLIIDEASQATEPSVLIPLSLVKSDVRYPLSQCC